MKLSKENLINIAVHNIDLPHSSIFDLPEKVIQFGTGSLLRGLPDDFIHRANQAGLFNGRILVVKSTTQGDSSAFNTQDALYTLCVQGYSNGKIVDRQQVNASISRVLSAQQSWSEILETATNPQMEILLSNTTDAGLVEDNGDIGGNPPLISISDSVILTAIQAKDLLLSRPNSFPTMHRYLKKSSSR